MNALDGQRHRLIFFEVDYPVGKYNDGRSRCAIFDTRYQFMDVVMLGEEPPADMYTLAHARGLFLVLRSLTTPLAS